MHIDAAKLGKFTTGRDPNANGTVEGAGGGAGSPERTWSETAATAMANLDAESMRYAIERNKNKAKPEKVLGAATSTQPSPSSAERTGAVLSDCVRRPTATSIRASMRSRRRAAS